MSIDSIPSLLSQWQLLPSLHIYCRRQYLYTLPSLSWPTMVINRCSSSIVEATYCCWIYCPGCAIRFLAIHPLLRPSPPLFLLCPSALCPFLLLFVRWPFLCTCPSCLLSLSVVFSLFIPVSFRPHFVLICPSCFSLARLLSSFRSPIVLRLSFCPLFLPRSRRKRTWASRVIWFLFLYSGCEGIIRPSIHPFIHSSIHPREGLLLGNGIFKFPKLANAYFLASSCTTPIKGLPSWRITPVIGFPFNTAFLRFASGLPLF